jgi:hypothetical protein
VSGFTALKGAIAVPTLAQVYEDRAADCTRAAEQTDDPVFRNLLLTLTGRAARSSDAIGEGRKRLTALVEMTAKRR